jgi:hypothetical protein
MNLQMNFLQFHHSLRYLDWMLIVLEGWPKGFPSPVLLEESRTGNYSRQRNL